MQTETYLVAIGVLLLALILRPAPVVIVQRDRDESPSLGWVLGLALIGGAIWFFSQPGCFETPSIKEDGVTPERVKSKTRINEAPPKKQFEEQGQDTIINMPPKGTGTFGHFTGYNENIHEENVELEPRLVVFLRAYQDYESAEQLQAHFSIRNISIVEMDNGQYWAVIEVESKKEGREEIKDWLRHKGDWSRFGLNMKIIDLNNP